MNERERILNLLSDGRINAEEATLLMDALSEVESPTRSPRGAIPPEPRGFHPAPPMPPIPPIPPIAPIRVAVGRTQDLLEPPNLKWIRVHLASEDLEVIGDSSLEQPSIEGDVQVSEENGAIVVSSSHGAGRGKGGVFAGVHWNLDFELGDDPVIRLPDGWGLTCEMASGDLEVKDLAFVRGNLASGDATLTAVRGVDLRVISGDVEAELILNEGQHRLEAMSGDVELVFVDSSVRIEGKLGSGDLDARGNFSQEKRKISGQVGEGKAVLQIVIASGDLSLEDRHGN